METMARRRGLTLVEFLVVLGIMAVLVGLLMPAVMVARQRARETVCKNHVRQLALGLAQFLETSQTLPAPPASGQTGGWCIEVLPFVEQQALYGRLSAPLSLTAVPVEARVRPPVMRCPLAAPAPSTSPPIEAAHFVLAARSRSGSFQLLDAPLGFEQPWLASPRIDFRAATKQPGPHKGGFHIAGPDGSVRLLVESARVP